MTYLEWVVGIFTIVGVIVGFFISEIKMCLIKKWRIHKGFCPKCNNPADSGKWHSYGINSNKYVSCENCGYIILRAKYKKMKENL